MAVDEGRLRIEFSSYQPHPVLLWPVVLLEQTNAGRIAGKGLLREGVDQPDPHRLSIGYQSHAIPPVGAENSVSPANQPFEDNGQSFGTPHEKRRERRDFRPARRRVANELALGAEGLSFVLDDARIPLIDHLSGPIFLPTAAWESEQTVLATLLDEPDWLQLSRAYEP
jgi:hypothetical protein